MRLPLLAVAMLSMLVAHPAQAGPVIHTFQAAGGVPAYMVAAPDLPIIDVRIDFQAGSARDDDLSGLAALTARLLSEGVQGLSAQEIHEQFASLGVEYEFEVARDAAWFRLRMLSDPEVAADAVRLLARLLSVPTFAPQSFARERARLIRSIQERQESPAARAEDAFYRTLYGSHPYAMPTEGEQAALEHLSLDDVRRFHTRYYVAANASLAFVGDLDGTFAQRLADTITETLPGGDPAVTIPSPASPGASRDVKLEHASTQTHFLLGSIGMKRDDDDYFPLYVGNYILGGGGFVSRLFEEVREKRGLSYSVYSYFFPLAQAGPFIAGAATRNAQAEQAVAAVRDTILTFIAHGPTPQELRHAKENIIGGFPLRFDSNAKLLAYVAMIGFYRLPLDYLDRFPERIAAVSLADIKEAFQRRIKPSDFVSVTVGGGAAAGSTGN